MPSEAETTTLTIGPHTAHAQRHGTGDQGVIVLHGLASEARELGPLPGRIAEAGFTVLAPDLRGHGASQGPRGRLSIRGVLEDLMAWQDHLEDAGIEPVAVGGHSLGGCWAMLAAAELAPRAVFAACSPASITDELGRLETMAYRLGGAVHALASRLGLDGLSVPYRVGPDEVLDAPEAIDRMEEAGMIQPTIPLANVETLLELDATGWAAEATCPGLIGAARNDRVVGRHTTRRLYEAYGGPKDWVELPGPHSCFLDRQGAACAETIAEWLSGVLA